MSIPDRRKQALKSSWGSGLVLFLLFAGGSVMLFRLTQTQRNDHPGIAPAPPAPSSQPTSEISEPPVPKKTIVHGAPGVRQRASDLNLADKTDFQKKFAERIRPAIARWCNTYAGHLPFRLEDVTPDKLREIIFPGSEVQGYAFVINGTTLSVRDDRGTVFVDYLMAAAATRLFQMPKDPAPPLEPTVSREEILRLLKADSGRDIPPGEVSLTPTSRSGSMNGGVSVEVGHDLHADLRPLPDFSMVFGPDGNLACYLRDQKPGQ